MNLSYRKDTKEVEIINEKSTGDLIINADTQYNDVLADNVTVKEDVTTRIYGVIKNSLTVEKGAMIFLHGKAPMKIINNDGTVYVFGPSGEVKTF